MTAIATTILITGFLGAGKSTLALRLRDHLGPGCTVVEASGCADPASDPASNPAAGAAAGAAVGAGATGTVILAVADAVNAAACLDDALIAPLVRAQLRAAALVALSRTDLVDPAPARRAVAGITDAALVEAPNGVLPPEVLDRLPALRRRAPAGPSAGPSLSIPFAEWRYDGPAVLRGASIDGLLGPRIPGLYRLSGQIRGSRGGVDVQLAGRMRQTQPIAMPAETRLVATGPAERFRPDRMALRFAEAVAASAHLSGLFGYR